MGIYLEMGDLVRKFQPSAVVLGRDNSQTGGETGARFAMGLRARYAMHGTESGMTGYAGYPLWNTCDTQDGTERGNCALSQVEAYCIVLGLCYALPGTDVRYTAPSTARAHQQAHSGKRG
eukprot:2745265-Rhodomonas_salina.2